ncbi:MAG: hypothetical protein EKK53_05000 [Burkholderiales bacterium]|nr:MAG: hypothetical protein EKK53_05000 [Burkholderiales bacterium]
MVLLPRIGWSAEAVDRADSPIDRQLRVIEAATGPSERRRLASELVDLCAFPPGNGALRLNAAQMGRLTRLLEDPEPWIRANAAACLGFNGPAAAQALPALREAQRRTSIVDYPGFPGLPEASQPRELIGTAIRRIEGAIPVRNTVGASSPGT